MDLVILFYWMELMFLQLMVGDRIVLLDDQVSNIIMEDEVLKLELGSDNIVLDGTDEDSSNDW